MIISPRVESCCEHFGDVRRCSTDLRSSHNQCPLDAISNDNASSLIRIHPTSNQKARSILLGSTSS